MSARAVMAPPAADRHVGAWPRHVMALGAVAAAMGLLYGRDIAGMAAIWWGSSSYEHCLVILPVIAWLVWIRRASLGALQPSAWLPPLVWVAAGAGGWLLGAAGDVAVARHLGVVMMAQGAAGALLGASATRVLLFPFGFAFFLVPAGDALVPPLQTLTARMCMALLHLADVPAHLDGVFITTPHGWFKIAEACSGAKFLIAMAALGVLVAHLGFSTWRRRLPFFALCIVVPILANGVRAFATIWVAQRRGVRAAAGFDHVVYGWIFFAVVIAIVLAIAWRFFDRAPDAVPAPRMIATRSVPLGTAVAATLLIAGAAPAWMILSDGRAAAIAAEPRLPLLAGWTGQASTYGDWRPRFDGADRLLAGRYRDAAGQTVDLAAALYARQGDGRELVGYAHGAADPEGVWTWAADEPAPAGWQGERIEDAKAATRIAWTRYVVDGHGTSSPAVAKLLTLRARLLAGDPLAGALIVSAPADARGRAAAAAFVRSLDDPVAVVDRIAGR